MTPRSLAKLLLFAAVLSVSLAASPAPAGSDAPGDYGPWLPKNYNANGGEIDHLFYIILYITGFFFVLVELLIVAFLVIYRRREGAKSKFVHGHKPLEVVWTLVPAAILVWLALYQKDVWERHKINFPIPEKFYCAKHMDKPSEKSGKCAQCGQELSQPTLIEVTAEQFKWYIRYPGPDRKFGPTRPEFAKEGLNPLGIDWKDAASKDDIWVINTLHAPVDKPVLIRLRSRDVLHSFFVPVMRVKQDAVPGLKNNRVWFLPDTRCQRAKKKGPDGTPLRSYDDEVNDWEIACAELCGNLHYTMRGYVRIETEEEYQEWLARMDQSMERGDEE